MGAQEVQHICDKPAATAVLEILCCRENERGLISKNHQRAYTRMRANDSVVHAIAATVDAYDAIMNDKKRHTVRATI